MPLGLDPRTFNRAEGPERCLRRIGEFGGGGGGGKFFFFGAEMGASKMYRFALGW